MSQSDTQHAQPKPSVTSTEWPWEDPEEQTPRDVVVSILAEGIWEMVLDGKAHHSRVRGPSPVRSVDD